MKTKNTVHYFAYNLKKGLLLVLSILFVNLNTDAQAPPQIQWQRSTDQTLGDGGDNAFQQTKDRGFIKTNDGFDWIITKYSELGNVEWSKQINAANPNLIGQSCDVISQIQDGGFIVGGEITLNLGKDNNGVPIYQNLTRIVKLNSLGGKVFEKSYPSTTLEVFKSLKGTSDGGYIAAGSSGNTNSFTIVKFDNNLNAVWQANLGPGTAFQTQETSDKGFLVAGINIIAKIDKNGKLQWQKNTGTSGYDIYSVQPTNEGGFIYAGRGIGNFYYDYDVIKFDSNGVKIWEKILGGSGSDKAFSVCSTVDGGYIISGGSTSSDGDVTQNFGGIDCWVVKLNSKGDLIWQKSIGGPGDEVGYAIRQTTDKGFIIFTGSGNFGLIKLYPEFKAQVQQPNVKMINDDGSLNASFPIPDTAAKVNGAATDGNTKLLITVTSLVPVTFTLDSKDNGKLSTLDNQNVFSTDIGSVKAINGKATVIYTAPDGYGLTYPPGGRYVKISATSDLADTSSVTLQLVTPPVLMIHGMWSDSTVWTNSGGFTDVMKKNGINKIYLVDYREFNTDTFDPTKQESKVIRDFIDSKIHQAIEEAAAKNIIVTQVDVVGHSLGGLQARGFSQDNRFLNLADNYKKGYFHKLITIGTPHLGSEWGPIVYNTIKAVVNVELKIENYTDVFSSSSAMPVGSCQKDFNPNFKNTGEGLDNLTNKTPFKVHAIEARWDFPGSKTSNGWADYLAILFDNLKKGINSTLSEILRDTSSDLIVPRYSQLGGLTDKRTYDHFDYTTHSSVPSVSGDYTETTNLQIINRVSNLLLSNDPSLFANGFPAPKDVQTPFDQSASPQLTRLPFAQSKYSLIKLNSNLNADSSYSATHNVLKIRSPTKTSLLKNNGTDSVTLALTFTDDSKLEKAVFIVQGIGYIALPRQFPHSVKVVLPNSTNAGKINISALGIDIYGNLFADTLSINIQGSDTLKSITVSPDSTKLDSLNRTASLSVNGLFVNGKDTVYRNLTSAQTGTTYAPVSKNSIISVTAGGQVNGLKVGTDTVLIKNQNFTVKVPVTVDPSLLQVVKFTDAIVFGIDNKEYGDPPTVLNGTNSSGDIITYKLSSGPVVVSNGILTINGTGQAKIIASSQGNAYYKSAPNDTVTFNIQKASQVISFPPLSPVTYGHADFGPGATVSSSLAVTYTSGNKAVATIVNNKIHIVSSGTVNITASQAGNADYNAAASLSQTLIINPSTNANLSSLKLSSGTLTPTFADGVVNYTASVTGTTTSITVTPTTDTPGATVIVNGSAVTTGTVSMSILLNFGPNIITTVVTAQDGKTQKTYIITVNRGSNNAYLSNLKISGGTLSPAFQYLTNSYTTSVTNAVTSITVTPTLADLTATATVNGNVVASKAASPVIHLHAGVNNINVVVTAQNGVATDTYTIAVTRAPSTNDNLVNLAISSGTLTPAFGAGTLNYTASVSYATASVTVTPTVSDPDATITVNGVMAVNGSKSKVIPLTVGSNTISTVVTASDGMTSQTYTITVTRFSNNTLLSKLTTAAPAVTLTTVTGPGYKNYTASIANTVSSIKIAPTTSDPNATVTVNGVAVISGTPSSAIALTVGVNTITTVVTAQDGVTHNSYIITVTRAAGPVNIPDEEVAVAITSAPNFADDGIIVHPAVSPNGDGVNDYLTIENIASYPENKLLIMNRDGALVYEAKGYDNQNKVFDGHSNKNGQMQLPGTYFYSLDYTVKGVAKHKTGFLVLKY